VLIRGNKNRLDIGQTAKLQANPKVNHSNYYQWVSGTGDNTRFGPTGASLSYEWEIIKGNDVIQLVGYPIATKTDDRGPGKIGGVNYTLDASEVSYRAINTGEAEIKVTMKDQDGVVLAADTYEIEVADYYGVGPTAIVTGPTELMVGDPPAAFTFSMKYLPENVNAISITLRVEDEFFTCQQLNLLNGWLLLGQTGWELVDGVYENTLSIYRTGPMASGSFDFLEAVLVLQPGAKGTTVVEIADAKVATPGGFVTLGTSSAPIVVEVDDSNRYDVNGDGKVDLADVAAAAYFFMSRIYESTWDVAVEFDTSDPLVKLPVKPKRCDVNRDGVVDIEDLIAILANFSK
jgi:hypothetical protein